LNQQGARCQPPAAGFTLLELLVAVAILGIVAGGLYGTFARTSASRVHAQLRAETFDLARATIDGLERDLAGSFDIGGYDPQTLRFLGVDTTTLSGREDTALVVDFTAVTSRQTTPPSGLGAVPAEGTDLGDEVRVAYRLERRDDDSRQAAQPPERGFALVRYELRPPTSQPIEQGTRSVVARGVEALVLRFWDGSRWVSSWDSSSGGGRNGRAPSLVETRLRLAGADGSSADFVSTVYLPLGGRQ